jgi:restriction system protein
VGRRRDGGALGDLFEITASFPWWLGVALAVAAYGLLHWYAVKPLEPAITPGHVAAFNPSPIYKGLAQAFQYILPIVFLGGAVASAIGRMTRKALVTKVAGAKSPGVLQDDMTWEQFEMLVAEAFRLEGYAVQGKEFLGCAAFPKCTGTRSIA